MNQNGRYVAAARRKKNRSSRNTLRDAVFNLFAGHLKRRKARGIALLQKRAAAVPDQHGRNERRADQHGHITTLEELEQVRAKKGNIEREKEQQERRRLPFGPLPSVSGNNIKQYRGDGHGAGHRNAVSGRELHRF